MSTTNNIDVRIRVDNGNLQAGLNQAASQINSTTQQIGQHSQININIDLAHLRQELQQVGQIIRTGLANLNTSGGGNTVHVNVDTSALQAELRHIAAVQARLMRQVRDSVNDVAGSMQQGLAGGVDEVGEATNRTSGFIANLKANLASMAIEQLTEAFFELGRAMLATSDSAALLNARFKDLLGAGPELVQMKDDLFKAAQRLQVGYEDMAKAAARSLPSLQDMGMSQAEAARNSVKLAEILMTTAKLSGASTEEAAASAQQFSQALGSGVLQGDELKSILENNQALARTLAAALKMPDENITVTIGKLRELGEKGQITSRVMAEALLNSYDTVMAKADELPQTFGGAWAKVKNIFFRTMDEMNQAELFSGTLQGLKELTDGFQALQQDGSIQQFAQDTMAVLAELAAVFGELVTTVADVCGEISTLWGNLAGAVGETTGTQIRFVDLLVGALKGFQTFMIGLRTGLEVIWYSMKAVVVAVFEAIIAAAISMEFVFKWWGQAIGGTVEGLRDLISTCMQAVDRALHLDFAGAAAAWDDGMSRLESIVAERSGRIANLTAIMASKMSNLSMQSIMDAAAPAADAAEQANKSFRSVWLPGADKTLQTKPAEPRDIAPVQKVTVAPPAEKEKKAKKPPKSHVVRDLESGLQRQRLDWEDDQQRAGTLVDFPLERVRAYWADVLSNHKLTAEERQQVEKRLSDANRSLRQRDRQAELEQLRQQVQDTSQNSTLKLEAARAYTDRIKAIYGSQSDEYRKALRQQEDAQRDADRKRYEMALHQSELNQQVALDRVDTAQANMERDDELGLLSQREKLEALRDFEQQRFEITRDAIADRIKLYREENERTGGKLNPTDLAKLIEAGDANDTSHRSRDEKIGGQLYQLDNSWIRNLSETASSLWDQGLDSMLNGTLTWRNAMQGIWQGMSRFFVQQFVSEPLKQWAAGLGRQLLLKLGFVKSATAAVVAGQAAETGATTAGETARIGIVSMASIKRLAIKAAETIKSVMMNAWEAMSAAYASIAAIPVVGPVLAPVTAAATFAGVAALAGRIKSASGGYDIPRGVNPMTQLHAEEMVLPAQYANVIRGMAGESGPAAAGHTINVHVNAVDARSVSRLFKDNRGGLAEAIRAGVRDFKRG